MPLSKKDEQIEALFNPQTVDDKEAVNLLCIVGRLADEHRGDRKYIKMIVMLSATALALSRISGNIDEQVFSQHSKEILDEYWKGLGHGHGTAGA